MGTLSGCLSRIPFVGGGDGGDDDEDDENDAQEPQNESDKPPQPEDDPEDDQESENSTQNQSQEQDNETEQPEAAQPETDPDNAPDPDAYDSDPNTTTPAPTAEDLTATVTDVTASNNSAQATVEVQNNAADSVGAVELTATFYDGSGNEIGGGFGGLTGIESGESRSTVIVGMGEEYSNATKCEAEPYLP